MMSVYRKEIKKVQIFILFLLLSCGSCAQNNKPNATTDAPKEKFSVIEAKMANGKPIIGSINMAYKGYDKKEKYPWCLKISIALNLDSVSENGLPSQGETGIANKMEDELLAKINTLSAAQYIGHIYGDTFLDVYVYLDEPKKVHDLLQTQINKPGLAREFAYEINQDPKWDTVSGFIR